MTDRDQVDAMENIMKKMQGASSNGASHTDSNNSSEATVDPNSEQAQVNAMADVLKKLEESTSSAAENLVTESKTNHDLGVAAQTKRTDAGVSVSHYEIFAEKKTIQESFKKNFYSIRDTRSGNLVYEDLSLFETAMGIVKHLLFTENENKIKRIVELDSEYMGFLSEVHRYKNRIQKLDESSTQHDVASAKYSNSKSKLSHAKLKLLKAI